MTKGINNSSLAVLLMLVVQFAFAAINVLYKLAIHDGMNMRVATAYRLAFASASTIPLGLIFDRKKTPKITLKVLLLAFLCGLFGGSLYQNLFFEGLSLMPATFMLAMFNLVPAITFIMAISCGLEKLNLGVVSGKAKVLGTAIGIGGAMLLTFYKGVEIDIWSSHINLLDPHHNQNDHMTPFHAAAGSGSKVLGVTCAMAAYCSYSFWLIIQAKMSKEYPCHYLGTALMSTMGAIQAIVFALCVERDWSQWKLGWNVRLLAVAYSGIVPSGIMIVVIGWCLQKRGPLFASIFNPLQLIIVAIAAFLVLGENLYLGSVLGSMAIVLGLYIVLWGKSKEMKKKIDELESFKITGDFEAVEVNVISTSLGHDKHDHNNYSQTSSNRNVV